MDLYRSPVLGLSQFLTGVEKKNLRRSNKYPTIFRRLLSETSEKIISKII